MAESLPIGPPPPPPPPHVWNGARLRALEERVLHLEKVISTQPAATRATRTRRGEPKGEPVAVRLGLELDSRVRHYAEQHGVSVSDVIREALIKRLGPETGLQHVERTSHHVSVGLNQPWICSECPAKAAAYDVLTTRLVEDLAKDRAEDRASEPATCHCGKPVITHYDSNGVTGFTRGLCKRCDEVRCDVVPAACYPTAMNGATDA